MLIVDFYNFFITASQSHILPLSLPGLEVGDWRLPLNQDDVQDVEEPVEDPGIQGPEGEVVDNVEREYAMNDEMEKGEVEEDDEVHVHT